MIGCLEQALSLHDDHDPEAFCGSLAVVEDEACRGLHVLEELVRSVELLPSLRRLNGAPCGCPGTRIVVLMLAPSPQPE